MADILIKGLNPKSEDGKEYYLHSTDWWVEIVNLIEDLIPEEHQVAEYFVRECIICPKTPLIDGEESVQLSKAIGKYLSIDAINKYLLAKYQNDDLYIEYFLGDKDLMTDHINERVEQLEKFSNFLKNSGGCRVKWHGM
jgi:hypothetical protein